MKYDLTEGPIFKKLLALSMPIMATSFMQAAQTMTNMFWLGGLGERYVAAAGLASQFLWLSMAFIFLCRTGAEIGVSQNMGKGDVEAAKKFAQNGFMLALLFGTLYMLVIFLFNEQLIQFFNVEDPYVVAIARQYFVVIGIGLPFIFAHFVITGVFGGFGNTKIPFYINAGALLLNIILNPIFIFVLNLGIIGAGLSLVLTSILNFLVKVWAMTKYKGRPFEGYAVFTKLAKEKVQQILRWGVPVALESFLFTTLFMVVSRLVSSEFGTGAIAAHQVGMNIESMAFMVAGGFMTSVTVFVGQNFGAVKWARLRRTVKVGLWVMGTYGLVVALAMFIFAPTVVAWFLDDPASIHIATMYLRILAPVQVLFCMEGVVAGSFRGRGLTTKPTIASVISNIVRVIASYVLASSLFYEAGFGLNLGINGVWIAITIAMTMRSVWLLVWHVVDMRKYPVVDATVEEVEVA